MRNRCISYLFLFALGVTIACMLVGQPIQNTGLPSNPLTNNSGNPGSLSSTKPNNEMLAYLTVSNSKPIKIDLNLINPEDQASKFCVSCQLSGIILQEQYGNLPVAWSPDHTRIAFLLDHGATQTIIDLYVSDLEGKTKLLKSWPYGFDLKDVIWSPDSSMILIGFPSAEGNRGIDILSSSNGTEQFIATEGRDPIWLNNKTIAYFKTLDSGQIYTIDLSDFEPKLLSQLNLRADPLIDPIWSPAGDRLFVIGNEGFYVMNRDGTGLVNLQVNGKLPDEFSWAPDGQKIVFSEVSPDNKSFDIYIADSHTGSLTRLTNSTIPEIDPSWSPDGTKIAFSSFGNGNVYVMNSDGTNVQTLISSSNADTPVWR
jgi:Tol biopolymer transport system component